MAMTLMLCASVGLALGLVANVFGLLALAVAFASIGLLAAPFGAPHPFATIFAGVCALEFGYAAGLFALARAPRRTPSVEPNWLRSGRR